MNKTTKKKQTKKVSSGPQLKPNIMVLGDRETSKKLKNKLRNFQIELRIRKDSPSLMESIDQKTLAVIAVTPLESGHVLHFVKTFKKSPVGHLPIYVVLFRELPERTINHLYENGVEAVFYWEREKDVMLDLITRNLKLHLKSPPQKVRDLDDRLENFLKCKLEAHGFSNPPKFTVQNAQIKLQGNFPTLHHRRRITEYFEQAPGVHAVDLSEAYIKKFSISDKKLKERVLIYLENIEELNASDLKILVVHGVVTLIGEVSTPDISREAEQMVEQIKGVREIHNFLEAKAPQKQQQGKNLAAKLTTQIQKSFPEVEDIEIVFYKDVATVSGKVGLLSNKKYIEQFILQNSQVEKVINKIQVNT